MEIALCTKKQINSFSNHLDPFRFLQASAGAPLAHIPMPDFLANSALPLGLVLIHSDRELALFADGPLGGLDGRALPPGVLLSCLNDYVDAEEEVFEVLALEGLKEGRLLGVDGVHHEVQRCPLVAPLAHGVEHALLFVESAEPGAQIEQESEALPLLELGQKTRVNSVAEGLLRPRQLEDRRRPVCKRQVLEGLLAREAQNWGSRDNQGVCQVVKHAEGPKLIGSESPAPVFGEVEVEFGDIVHKEPLSHIVDSRQVEFVEGLSDTIREVKQLDHHHSVYECQVFEEARAQHGLGRIEALQVVEQHLQDVPVEFDFFVYCLDLGHLQVAVGVLERAPRADDVEAVAKLARAVRLQGAIDEISWVELLVLRIHRLREFGT